MKGITLCADCAYYDLKKHKCNRGATVDPDMSKGQDVRFYVDCPLPDVQEVRHGRMIEGRYPNENKCSECGQEFRDDIGFIIQDGDGIFHYPKRCPNCGCYWDGKLTLGSEANGCWISCAECANTGCKNRYVQEAKEDE